MDDVALLVCTNLPDAQSAHALARDLLERRLAACVNILPGVRSAYRWQGGIEEASETSLMIKTTQLRYAALEQAIAAAHPYEVPEIIAMPIVAGLPAYLGWLAQETNGNGDAHH
jgi:periplasmic divalent cation tolerance protein